MTSLAKWIAGLVVLVILAILLVLIFDVGRNNPDGAVSFEDCLAKGYPVLEIYPRRCIDDRNQTFVENIGNEIEKTDLIRISSPRPNELIRSSLEITGFARGNWFFEASFPIVLLDENGRQVSTGIATALDSWMTEEFVPFKAELTFASKKLSGTGKLILKKDNPSGDPKLDDALIIPVLFGVKPVETIQTNLATST